MTHKLKFQSDPQWEYAFMIRGVAELPVFLRHVHECSAVTEFKSTARSTWITAKLRKGKNAKTEIRAFIRDNRVTGLYAQWSVGDDSIQLYFTANENAYGGDEELHTGGV